MRLFIAIVIFIVLGLCACDKGNKGVTFSTMKFDCRYSTNPIDIYQPYFDTLQLFIRKDKPDFISFKETEFTPECIKKIEVEGYEFIPINMPKDSSMVMFSPVAIKTTSFEFLASSYYIYKNDTLSQNKNMLSWYQLKSNISGHIFYMFRLQLQDSLNTYQSQIIAFDLLKRIDEISAGVPVILMGNFNDTNAATKELLTDNWKDVYALSDVIPNDKNSDFLVNDFIKIINSDPIVINDSLINKVVVRFTFNTDKISKNKNGETIPE